MLFLARNIILVYSLLFVIGALTITKGTLFYLYFLELLPERKRIKYHTASGIIGLAVNITTIVFFYYVSNWLLCFPLLILASVMHSFFLCICPESPKYLYSKRKYKECHEAIALIGRMNGVNSWDHKFAAEVNSDLDNEEYELSIFTALKDSMYRKNLVIMTINWIVCSLSFYIVGFYLNDFPGSIFINGSIMV